MSFELVITAALKQELPINLIENTDIPCVKLAALKSGILKTLSTKNPNILVVITGVGRQASVESANFIAAQLSPNYVINIGTAGITNKTIPLGTVIYPKILKNNQEPPIMQPPYLPLPISTKITQTNTPLLTIDPQNQSNPPKNYLLDMEAYYQAKIFNNHQISFHTLKIVSDYADNNTSQDHQKTLKLLLKNHPIALEWLTPICSISVIIPVYNRDYCILKCIQSVLDQTLQPKEIIIIDDGSTDKTNNLLKTLTHPLIKVITLPKNKGVSAARNIGLNAASGDWIAFLDSDDLWTKDKLKNQWAFICKYPFFEILQSEETWIRNGKRINPHKHHQKQQGWIFEKCLHLCLISPSGVIIKKSLLEKNHGFDETLPACEDYDLWLKITRHHIVGLEKSQNIIKHGGHPDQLSTKYIAMDRFRVQSLYTMQKNETNPNIKRQITQVLEKKLSILLQGIKKRQKKT